MIRHSLHHDHFGAPRPQVQVTWKKIHLGVHASNGSQKLFGNPETTDPLFDTVSDSGTMPSECWLSVHALTSDNLHLHVNAMHLQWVRTAPFGNSFPFIDGLHRKYSHMAMEEDRFARCVGNPTGRFSQPQTLNAMDNIYKPVLA